MDNSHVERSIEKVRREFCVRWSDPTRTVSFHRDRILKQKTSANVSSTGNTAPHTGCIINLLINRHNKMTLIEDDGRRQTYVCMLFNTMFKYLESQTGCLFNFTVSNARNGAVFVKGKPTGLYGYLYNNTADIYTRPATFKLRQLEIMNYGRLIPAKSVLSVVSISRKKVTDNLDKLLEVFTPIMWALIGLSFLVCLGIKLVAIKFENHRLSASNQEYNRTFRPRAKFQCRLVRPIGIQDLFQNEYPQHQFHNYGSVTTFFLVIVFGFGSFIPRWVKSFDIIVLFWIWCSFMFRQLFSSNILSAMVYSANIRIDSLDQLLDYVDYFNIYVESEGTSQRNLLTNYPQFNGSTQPGSYIGIYHPHFQRQFYDPEFRFSRNNLWKPKLPAKVKIKNPEGKIKMNSALVGREINMEQVANYYKMFGYHKAKYSAEINWYCNFPTRINLNKTIAHIAHKLFWRLYSSGIFDKINNDEIYFQRFVHLSKNLLTIHDSLMENAKNQNSTKLDMIQWNRKKAHHQRLYFVKLSDNVQPTGSINDLYDDEVNDNGDNEGNKQKESEASTLGLVEILPYFYFYLINNAISILVFLLELLWRQTSVLFQLIRATFQYLSKLKFKERETSSDQRIRSGSVSEENKTLTSID